MTQINLSVVVPVYNEAENVSPLAAEISSVLDPLDILWECIWVNDSSADGTAAALEALCRNSATHRCVTLPRNSGQSAALAVGFRVARGGLIATMDGDGQNDPSDIPLLLTRLEQGDVDMVNGVRAKRRDSRVRLLSSRIGNGFRNRLTGDRVTDVGCSMRICRREFLISLPVFKGMHRFLPTLARMKGCRITEIPVRHRPRLHGQSKYGIGNRLWVGLADTLAVRWMQRRMLWLEDLMSGSLDG